MLRYAGLVLLCFMSSVLGSAVTLLAAGPRADEAGMEASGRTLVAQEIVLKDPSGTVRARLRAENSADGAAPGQLVLYDEHGASRLRAGAGAAGETYLVMANSSLPNPDHKRILLAVNASTARLEMGHGDLKEVTLQSAPPSSPPANLVRVRARNGSEAALYTDAYGHATAEVTDLTMTPIFRTPEWRPVLPE